MAPFVDIRDVSLTFASGTTALAGISLAVEEGEFVSIVGPSGCGKSTLLRLVAGLLPPTAGAVTVDGIPAPDARARRNDVAFVFQSPTLLPWRTVEKNIRLPFELNGRHVPAADRRERIDEVLELVGLADFRRAYPHQLSGGMQMRVSIARALVTRPRLLLLDEPFGALDDITRIGLNEELLALWERDQVTALFVTHNVTEAVFLGSRVLVMRARPGRFVADHTIPFPHPRDPDLRNHGDFARLCGTVASSLREAHHS